MPLWLRVGVQLSVAFRRDGDVLRGESVRDCGFQRLRGPHGGPEGFVPIGGGEFVVLDDTADAAPLCELLRRTPAEEVPPVIDPAVFARLALNEPRILAISDLSGPPRPGLYDAGSVVVVGPDRMSTYGTAVARDRFMHGSAYVAAAGPVAAARHRDVRRSAAAHTRLAVRTPLLCRRRHGRVIRGLSGASQGKPPWRCAIGHGTIEI